MDQRILIILQLIVVMDSVYVYRDNNVTRDGFLLYLYSIHYPLNIYIYIYIYIHARVRF
jgi:hypothetical protein